MVQERIKEIFLKLIWKLIGLYRRFPIQPFRSIFFVLYLKYIEPQMFCNKVVIVKRRNLKYKLYLQELIDSEIYYFGCWEPNTLRIFKKYIKPGMIVFDIGANIGAHSLQLAKIVGEKGQVFAVEPDSQTIKKLQENIKLNNFKNIIVIEKAFSDVNRNKEITLDEYVKINKINQIDFIKIDTEGYEYKIIKGGQESIRKFRPIMIIEFNRTGLEIRGNKIEDLIMILKKLGYHFFSEKTLKEYLNETDLLKKCLPKTSFNVLCKINKS